MKALVTGSSGFLGRFLVELLEKKGYSVTLLTSKNADLTKEDSLQPFSKTKFEQIFHLAAWTQAGDFCLKHPAEQWVINQKINTHILDFWQKHQRQALLVCMGTSCAYDPALPLSEENYFKGVPIDSLFTYAMTKRMLLAGLRSFATQYNMRYLYLIPSTLYGPSYHTDGRQLHFIFDLMRKILRGKKQGDKVVLWGDGEQKRELIHVRDFVSLMLQLLEKGVVNTAINIGSGKEHSIKEFAAKLCLIANYPFEKIEYDLTKYVGARSKVLEIKNLQSILPVYTSLPLETGLAETYAWFEESFSSLYPTV